MGLVEGKTLTELIPRQGLTLDRLLELSVPLTAAIAAAHDKGITHRDIKPGNVMVTKEGLVKVLDFGLAKVEMRDPIATEGPTQALTIEGSILGTTPYMSPEQIEGKAIDHRSDIFSLGVVLYEMATGERPFRGDSTGGLMSAILKDSPAPITEVRRDFPRQLGRIVGQCLEKEQRDRFQDARDLHNALRGLRREIDSEASSKPIGSAPGRTLGPSKTHRRWLVATTGIGLTLGLLWYGTRNTDKDVEVAVETVVQPVSEAVSAHLPMIAVLPFENLGKPDDDYFAIGMTEEITTRLASLSELGVIASTSARAYAGSDKTAQRIGEELGADYLVVGSVRWAAPSEGASRLRISPRLISAADDEQIWAESYDRVLEDVFGIQSDIATRIVESLDVTLSDSDRVGLETRPTENMQAYEYYLKAIAVPGSFAAEEVIREERALARRAVELDPNFLAAWYLLANSEHKLYGYGFDRSDEQRQRCWEVAQRVSDLAVDAPATRHAVLYSYYFHVERDYERALEEIGRVAELEPNNSSAHAGMAYAVRRMGRFDEALVEIRKAQRLAPRDAHLASQVGSILSYLRRYQESI
ncbi:MAG: protein kinase, partial [Acidobacteriota bacterium]